MSISGNYTALVRVRVSDKELKNQLMTVSRNIKPITLKVKIDVRSLDSQFKNFQKKLSTLDKQLQKVSNHASNLGGDLNKVSNNVKNMSAETNKAVYSNEKLGKSFSEITKRVFTFNASAQIVRLFQQSLVEAKDVVFDFDEALTEFKKVSDLSGDSLDSYTEKLGKMGEEVARTRSEMIQAATEFKKGGYSDEDSAQLSRIASLYQNVADSELSAGDASSYVISQMKAFDIEVEDAMGIIDKTNEVSNNFAVSSTDIVK